MCFMPAWVHAPVSTEQVTHDHLDHRLPGNDDPTFSTCSLQLLQNPSTSKKVYRLIRLRSPVEVGVLNESWYTRIELIM